MKTKVLIINFNRLILLKNMVVWCMNNGLEPVIIDNHSDYPALLEYYKIIHFKYKVRIIHIPDNLGQSVIWDDKLNLLGFLGIVNQRYIVTDSDLDLSNIPSDFLHVLNLGLDRYIKQPKVGFSLEINDLPNTKIGEYARQCEIKYWGKKLDEYFFLAPIDTTFALYREGVNYYTDNKGIRTNYPYVAKHIPWYYDDFTQLTEDEQYYFKTADKRFNSLKRRIL